MIRCRGWLIQSSKPNVHLGEKLSISTEALFKKITVLNSRSVSVEDENTFNISWGIDKNYQLGAAISIASILFHNQNKDNYFTFHIISNEFEDSFIRRLKKLADQYSTVIKLYIIDPEPLYELPKTDIWPISVYYRILSFEYFSNKLKKILYLDADVICKGGIDELIKMDIDQVYGAIVKDVNSVQNKNAQRLKDDKYVGKYFNSGVMYINLEEWRNNQLTKKTFTLLCDEKILSVLKYPDQDILNIMLFDKVKFLPRKFNAIYSLKSEFEIKNSSYYKDFINADTIFIHYTGVTKPWHDWANYESAYCYRFIYSQSPWKDEPYLPAKKKYELKEKYKHLIYQKKYIKGLITALQYNLA